MSGSKQVRPSQRRVGARAAFKPEFQGEVEALFQTAGIQPIYKELRSDGNLDYWFDKTQCPALIDSGVLQKIPIDRWAHYAIVGTPPTSH
jgi:hypothetical protein